MQLNLQSIGHIYRIKDANNVLYLDDISFKFLPRSDLSSSRIVEVHFIIIIFNMDNLRILAPLLIFLMLRRVIFSTKTRYIIIISNK